MKIVVIGGTGLIGKKLTELLTAAGHEAIPASPSSGVDTMTGEGLAAVLEGAAVVVDVTNPKSFEESEARNFFTTSTTNIVAAEKAAGVGHHIAVSVVGADRMDSGYMRAKVEQEKLLAASGVPYTILRATQFFEFLFAIGDFSTVNGEVHLPPVSMQPVAADDLAAELAKIAAEKPANGIVELAGPDKRPMPELVEAVFKAKADPRKIIVDPAAMYFGSKVDDGTLVPEFANPRITPTNFAAWQALQAK
jgi:uncharacterized protein YbjT (DUF2867 family)